MNDTYLGIDIGTSSIKAVEKDANGTPIRWGILERRGRPFHTTIQPLDIEDVAHHLKLLIAEMGAAASSAVVSVPAFLALTAVAEAADPRFIPATSGSFTMSASPMDSLRYFLAAIPNAVAEKYAAVFQLAGLRLEKIELESGALVRSLGREPRPVLIIDMGDRSTTFTVADAGLVKYLEQTDFAVASQQPDVIMNRAEKIAAEFQTKKNILCGGAVLTNLKGFIAPSLFLAGGLSKY